MLITHIVMMKLLTGASAAAAATTRRRIRDWGLVRNETIGETGLGDLGEF